MQILYLQDLDQVHYPSILARTLCLPVLLPEHKTERHDPLHMKERSSSRTDFFIFDGVRSSEV